MKVINFLIPVSDGPQKCNGCVWKRILMKLFSFMQKSPWQGTQGNLWQATEGNHRVPVLQRNWIPLSFTLFRSHIAWCILRPNCGSSETTFCVIPYRTHTNTSHMYCTVYHMTLLKTCSEFLDNYLKCTISMMLLTLCMSYDKSDILQCKNYLLR